MFNVGPHQQIGVDVDAQIASGRHWLNKSAVKSSTDTALFGN